MRKLNVGCGPNVLEGWVNADLHPIDGRVVGFDATQQFPFSDGEFDRIFSEHMIEHVPYAGGAAMLAECYRTLKPGGRIRISTPSLDFLFNLLRGEPAPICHEYVKWACAAFSPEEPVCPETVINNFVRAWGHTYIHSRNSLGDLMDSLGFENLGLCYVSVSQDPEFRNIENVGRMPEGFLQIETMTVEGEKP